MRGFFFEYDNLWIDANGRGRLENHIFKFIVSCWVSAKFTEFDLKVKITETLMFELFVI